MLIFVAGLMALVMDTASDRDNYIVLFSDPFANSRIEIGFLYYADILRGLGIPPEVGIVFTSILIYGLLARVWVYYIRLHWFESVFVFNFLVFSLFNYYLGTSIRMGLAMAVALFAAAQVTRGRYWLGIPLLLSPLLHYGAAPFVLSFVWLWVTRRASWRFHKVVIGLATLALPLLIQALPAILGLNGYYLQYFNEDLGQTERLFPFTLIFLGFALVLSAVKGNDSILRRIAFYSLPFFLCGMVTGIPIFGKMLIPNIFIAAIVVVADYKYIYVKNLEPNFRLFTVMCLNLAGVVYALKAYHYV